MYERLKNKDEQPTAERLATPVGSAKEALDALRAFLSGELHAEALIKFDAHNQCWKMSYHAKKKYVCDILAEKDAFTLVTRIPAESVGQLLSEMSPYARERIESDPFHLKGWVGYRVLGIEHLKDAKAVL